MSAGNYGKAFAYAAQQLGLPATVVMPDNAPVSRIKIIEVGYRNVKLFGIATHLLLYANLYTLADVIYILRLMQVVIFN